MKHDIGVVVSSDSTLPAKEDVRIWVKFLLLNESKIPEQEIICGRCQIFAVIIFKECQIAECSFSVNKKKNNQVDFLLIRVYYPAMVE